MSFMDPTPARYAIRIHGHPGATMLSTFPALASRRHGADTVLTALLDRSALWGVLAEIEALGLDLVAVRQLTPDRKSAESRDSWSPDGYHRRAHRTRLPEAEASMTSVRVRDPNADHLLPPQNAALLPIDYQPSPLATVRRTARDASA
jgi:hypothetical protein